MTTAILTFVPGAAFKLAEVAGQSVDPALARQTVFVKVDALTADGRMKSGAIAIRESIKSTLSLFNK